MAGELTVSERILYHLSHYLKFEDKYESPFDVTQDGISQACGISRAHAAIELKKLKAAGIIDERLSHVRRGKARRKVYFLTFAGKAKATDVVQYVKDNDIVTLVDPSKVSPDSTSRTRSAKRSSPLPAVREFFGREDELKRLGSLFGSPMPKVISLRGISGIGKTTLAAKFVSQLSGCRVFWHTVKPWDAPRTLADSLGRFFAENGSRRLAAYLSSGKAELGEMSFLLNEDLGENGFVFIFDDADASEGIQEFLRMFRHSSGTSKIIVTSEAAPGFYDNPDVVAKKDVVEIELGGLDREAALKILRLREIEGPLAEDLFRATNGHPLSLEMVTDSSPTEAKYQVSKFFEERFYAALAEPERALLQLASVFRRPFPADAIPKEIRQARKGSMLRESAPGKFEIHASLRGFVYQSMSREERAKWHSVAADHYLRAGNSQERLYHLMGANRSLEAEMMISRMGEELLAEGNVQVLWETLSSLTPSKPKYSQAVSLVKAKAASLVGKYDIAWSLLESISSEGEARSRADALVEMGRIRSKQGELKEASRLFEKALETGADSPASRAKSLRGLGVVESKLGNYAKAQELLERSARDAMAAMDNKGMLLAHMELGNVFIGRGMCEEAVDHFSKCAAGFGPVELTNVHVNLGVACATLGRSDEARVHLENAVKLADETGQPRAKAYALTSLAEILVKSGALEQAKESCFRALDIVTELDDKLGISAAYANLGMAEKAAGEIVASEEHYMESLSALDGLDVPRSLGMRKLEFGQLLESKGDRAGAQRAFEEAREAFLRVGATDLLLKAEQELKHSTARRK